MKVNSWRRNGLGKVLLSLFAAIPLAVGSFSAVIAQDATPVAANFITAERPFLVATDPTKLEVIPLITAGDKVGDFQMAGSPSGLSGYVDALEVHVFVTHSLTTSKGANLSPSKMSELVVNKQTNEIISASYIIDGTEGYEKLGSAVKVSEKAGLGDPLMLAGEASVTGTKGGIVIAYEPNSGKLHELPWLGHMNHAGITVVPGFTDSVGVLLSDGDPNGSELYLYVTQSREGLLTGDGQLYVFVATAVSGTADIAKGQELTGTFVAIDQTANVDAVTLQTAATAAGAFTFANLRGIAWNRNDGMQSNVFFADCGSKEGASVNGRLYTMTLDPKDPTVVTAFKVLLDGDNGDDIKNPSDINNSKTDILIAEELKKYNQMQPARIQDYVLADGTLKTLVTVDQSAGEGFVDSDDTPGTWMATGILNSGDLLGHGSWMAVVQTKSLAIPQFGGNDEGGQVLIMRPPAT